MIFSLFSVAEREALALEEKDIYIGFCYQVGILMEDHPTEENQSIRHVEITWVGHSFPNYIELASTLPNPLALKMKMDDLGGPQILNYRFIKEFTKGVEDSWSINALNHFFLQNPNYF